jgi:hypothetical protein
MSNKLIKIMIILEILLLSSSISVSSQVDDTKFGVNEGDSFKLTLSKLSGDYEDFGSEGQVSTFTVLDAEPGYLNSLRVEEDSGSDTQTLIMYLDEPGEFIIFTDWDYWEANGADVLVDDFSFDTNSVSITNGDEEFTFLGEQSSEGFFMKVEYTYFKDTGIIKKFAIKMDVDLMGVVSKGEMVIEYGDKSSPGFLPGFEFYLVLISLTTLVIPLAKRRKR